jgi:hypothetical protein
VTDERQVTDVGGRNTTRWTGRGVIATLEDVRNRSSDQRERAIQLFRLAV